METIGNITSKIVDDMKEGNPQVNERKTVREYLVEFDELNLSRAERIDKYMETRNRYRELMDIDSSLMESGNIEGWKNNRELMGDAKRSMLAQEMSFANTGFDEDSLYEIAEEIERTEKGDDFFVEDDIPEF